MIGVLLFCSKNMFKESIKSVYLRKYMLRDLKKKKNYVKTITQTETFILNHQESKYRICGSVPESITKY